MYVGVAGASGIPADSGRGGMKYGARADRRRVIPLEPNESNALNRPDV